MVANDIVKEDLFRRAKAHDASHFLLYPDSVLVLESPDDIVEVFQRAKNAKTHLTFRAGGTSLSGQSITSGILVDARENLRDFTIEKSGLSIKSLPGATLRNINNMLRRHGRALGPDPASEIAATLGGVVANNSSGMACGTHANSYKTLISLRFILPSGTTIDTADVDADDQLREQESGLYCFLEETRKLVQSSPSLYEELQRQYSIKNTMGYSFNAFIDFDRPIDIFAHLLIGSEGTLAFVSDIVMETVEVLPERACGLVVFDSTVLAAEAVPFLQETGAKTLELLDAGALKVAQMDPKVDHRIAAINVENHAALIVEYWADNVQDLMKQVEAAQAVAHKRNLHLEVTTNPSERAAIWSTRKGLYTAVAGARQPGTTALLEDVAVPVENLGILCEGVRDLAAESGYSDCVIFGHAKDGNIHFMLTDDFSNEEAISRFGVFTDALVELVLRLKGALKAEHGTGRVMAPFVSAQFGPEIYAMMVKLKELCDPFRILNPDVIITNDPQLHLRNLKPVPAFSELADRCVECGYCEPHCPSESLTFTPRMRIAALREIAQKDGQKHSALLRSNAYLGVETCAVDGMCQLACPVKINTADIVREERKASAPTISRVIWQTAAKHWAGVTRLGSLALTVAHILPAPLVTGITRLGRVVIGSDVVPLWTKDLPRGGKARSKIAGARLMQPQATSDLIYLPSCMNALFSGADGRGPQTDFQYLCEAVGLKIAYPSGLDSLCCGTPWSSKGIPDGYSTVKQRVAASVREASQGGQIPIVCDGSSCTEGLVKMLAEEAITVIDAPVFLQERVLPRLKNVKKTFPSLTLHPTCATSHLGSFPAVKAIAEAISAQVIIPEDWGCCAFAGDRGMLHPELTASATQGEAAEVAQASSIAHASSNRTCEIGMSRATSQQYQGIVSLLAQAVHQ